MTTYNWSNLNPGDVFGADTLPSFNAGQDQLIFDDTVNGAADVLFDGNDSETFLSLGGKFVTLNTAPFTITSGNVTFADGSVLIVGDNTTGVTEDGNANTIAGGGGNDLLVGGGGADQIGGGAGNDVFVFFGDNDDTFGNDVIDGGSGSDTLAYQGADFPVNVNLAGGSATGGDGSPGSTLSLTAIENVIGTANGDTISGSNAANRIEGAGGDDTLAGGGSSDSANDTLQGGAGDDRLTQTLGNDVIMGDDGQDILTFNGTAIPGPVHVDLSAGTSIAASSSATISGIEHVFGTAGDDTFTGGDLLHAPDEENGDAEIFRPSGGNDTITGAAGDGWITIVDYSNAASAVAVTLGNSNHLGTASGADIGTDTLVNVDRVRGGSGADLLTGGSYATTANGNFGEQFRGNAGNDTLDGDGSDTTIGAIGDNDTAEYQNSPFGVVVNLGTSALTDTAYGTVAGGTARDGWDSMGGGIDTLIGIDVIRGSAHADLIVGGGPALYGNERLVGNGGDDTLVGVNSNDEADYSSDLDIPGPVMVDLGAGTASDGLGGTDTLVNLFWARGGDFNDTLVGANGDVERLMGGRGDDLIDGGGTSGVSYAGYQFAVSGVEAFIENGSGTASDGQGGTDTLVNINGLWGSNFADMLTGGEGDQWFRGRGGNDTIDGGGGIDTVHYSDPNPTGVTVNLATGTATDGWGGPWNLQGTDMLLDIENVEGSGFGDRITGNGGANRLEGRDGNDTLNGGAGNDTMTGGKGNDNLNGGAAADSLKGDAGNDVLAWASTDSFDGGAGTDTLKLSSGSLNLTTIPNIKIKNIEQIDLTGAGKNRLTLNVSDLLDISSTTNTLKVLGSAGDSVDIVGSFTVRGAAGGFRTYKVGTGTLLVDTDILVS
jgi:Ca2+-binding RTX toxin-like protein